MNDNSIIIGVDPDDVIYISFNPDIEKLNNNLSDNLNDINNSDNEKRNNNVKIAVSKTLLITNEFFAAIIARWSINKSEIQLSADIPVVAFCDVLKKMRNPKFKSNYPEIEFYYEYFGVIKKDLSNLNSELSLCDVALAKYKEQSEAAAADWYTRIGADLEKFLRQYNWFENFNILHFTSKNDNYSNKYKKPCRDAADNESSDSESEEFNEPNIYYIEQMVSNFEDDLDDKCLLSFLKKNKFYCFKEPRNFGDYFYISIFNKKIKDTDKEM